MAMDSRRSTTWRAVGQGRAVDILAAAMETSSIDDVEYYVRTWFPPALEGPLRDRIARNLVGGQEVKRRASS